MINRREIAKLAGVALLMGGIVVGVCVLGARYKVAQIADNAHIYMVRDGCVDLVRNYLGGVGVLKSLDFYQYKQMITRIDECNKAQEVAKYEKGQKNAEKGREEGQEQHKKRGTVEDSEAMNPFHR